MIGGSGLTAFRRDKWFSLVRGFFLAVSRDAQKVSSMFVGLGKAFTSSMTTHFCLRYENLEPGYPRSRTLSDFWGVKGSALGSFCEKKYFGEVGAF